MKLEKKFYNPKIKDPYSHTSRIVIKLAGLIIMVTTWPFDSETILPLVEDVNLIVSLDFAFASENLNLKLKRVKFRIFQTFMNKRKKKERLKMTYRIKSTVLFEAIF